MLSSATTCLATLGSLQRRPARAVEEMRHLTTQYPETPSYRCVLAFALGEAGRAAEAAAEFERLAAEGFVWPPLDAAWSLGTSALSATCACLADAVRAEIIYEVLVAKTREWHGAHG